jgi:hypothetical protein
MHVNSSCQSLEDMDIHKVLSSTLHTDYDYVVFIAVVHATNVRTVGDGTRSTRT